MRGLSRYIPGASAEQVQQARIQGVAAQLATVGAKPCTLRKNLTSRRFTGDVVNPMSMQTVDRAANAAALAGAVASAPPSLPGLYPAPTVRRGN